MLHGEKIIFEINYAYRLKYEVGEKTTVLKFQRKPLREKDL